MHLRIPAVLCLGTTAPLARMTAAVAAPRRCAHFGEPGRGDGGAGEIPGLLWREVLWQMCTCRVCAC